MSRLLQDVKDKVKDLIGEDIDHETLFYKDVPLDDESESIDDYNILPYSTLIMYLVS